MICDQANIHRWISNIKIRPYYKVAFHWLSYILLFISFHPEWLRVFSKKIEIKWIFLLVISRRSCSFNSDNHLFSPSLNESAVCQNKHYVFPFPSDNVYSSKAIKPTTNGNGVGAVCSHCRRRVYVTCSGSTPDSTLDGSSGPDMVLTFSLTK